MLFPSFITPRLILRQFTSDDWADVYAYTSNSDVMTYIPEGCFTQAQAHAFVEYHSGEEARALALVLRAEQKLIGHISFHPWFAHETYEIGWVLHPDYQGQGYATEAAQALLEYGFKTLHLHRIIATCQPENPASYRIMEKLGMRCEAHFRQCIYRGDGLWWDEFFYAILHDEYKK